MIATMRECRFCGRGLVYDENDGWVDPEATGDDSIWRATCDAHDTFQAEHEPVRGWIVTERGER